ncbi:MAG: phosphoribosyltransferase [Bacteroidetes bacterium]|nr:phosphoribosyltransferase [Bacteroidota bacterium]
MSNNILNHQRISSILKRLAIEILERNYPSNQIILAGIANRGWILAEMLHKELLSHGENKIIELAKIILDKNAPEKSDVHIEGLNFLEKEHAVIVVDDVLYSGKTMMYALLPFLKLDVKKLQTLVLVHRDYQFFPVKADYMGISLATTYQEHVSVQLESAELSVEISS